MYKFLVAQKSYSKHEIVCALGNTPCSLTDPKRLQVDKYTFILPPFVIFHSCNPNTYIEWTTTSLKALKPIKKGETITYHYGTSEDDYSIGMFVCKCGSPLCVKKFRGFSFLNHKQRESIKRFISPYLFNKYYSQ